MTAPVVNGNVMPTADRDGPNRPFRPNAISIATPATTGGNTMGNSTNVSMTRSSGELRRANSSANGVPRQITTTMLTMLVTTDNRRACNTSVPERPARNPSCWLARISNASMGRPIKTT